MLAFPGLCLGHSLLCLHHKNHWQPFRCWYPCSKVLSITRLQMTTHKQVPTEQLPAPIHFDTLPAQSPRADELQTKETACYRCFSLWLSRRQMEVNRSHLGLLYLRFSTLGFIPCTLPKFTKPANTGSWSSTLS